ncbi:MAG TPA: ABC transporter ATP-binding protein [Firmicutes bacterium]|nr:ABC transporter ATP-binding protein [Bacillota bacterium]
MKTVIELHNVSFAYEQRFILEGIDLKVAAGDFFAIIGPNGGGKTTLLRLLLGNLEPVRGEIKVFNRPPRKARRFIGYVPQQGNLDRDFPVSALEVVLMGRLAPNRLFPRYQKNDYEAAYTAMRAVGVEGLAATRFGDLSGGQKQRTLIARALVAKPQLLILDEPTSSVDYGVAQEIYQLLARLNQEVTIVLVSHDLGYVASHLQKVAYLNRRLSFYHPELESQNSIAAWYGEKKSLWSGGR